MHERLIHDVAARATPLFDRQAPTTRSQDVTNSVVEEMRLKRWQTVLGSRPLLERRLHTCEFASDQLGALLRGAQPSDADLPTWATTLASVLRPTRPLDLELEAVSHAPDRSFDVGEPLPFQQILVPFVRHARAKFAAAAGSAADVFRTTAVAALERQLLAHLTFIASLTLGRDFYEYRFEQAPASAFEAAWCAQESSSDIYRAYLCDMDRGRLVELLDRHPVLARLLSQSLDQWTTAAVKFCDRFSRDFSDLRAHFRLEIDSPLGALADVRTDLSDRHHGGQTVIECILHTGERLIYKPRGVQPEVVFFRFLRWLNTCGLSLNLMEVDVVDRVTHGWAQCVRPAPPRSEAEVERFYRRAGMLLVVLYVLAITDIHCDNLIASGDHPVVVDLETLLSDGPRASEASVADSGMLPRWQLAADGHRFDTSALGADDTQDPGIRVPRWHSINTDQMMISEDTRPLVTRDHRARLDDTFPSVRDHLGPFLAGFEEAYFCFALNAPKLMTDRRLLRSLDDMQLRVLVRDTTTYARLHLYLLHPEFLEDGIDRSIELEWLARPITAPVSHPAARALLYERERLAMEALDIPYFKSSDWKDLEVSPHDEQLFMLCGERDSRVMVRRLASLSPTHYVNQRTIVEDAVRSRFGHV